MFNFNIANSLLFGSITFSAIVGLTTLAQLEFADVLTTP